MAMNFTSLLVAIVIVSLTALSMGDLWIGLSNNYGVEANTTYLKTYSVLVNITNTTDEIASGFIGDETSVGSIIDSLTSQGYNVIKIAFVDGFALIRAMLQDASYHLGIPARFVGGIIAIIMIVLVLLGFTIIIKAFKRL